MVVVGVRKIEEFLKKGVRDSEVILNLWSIKY
jgi:hypothetical protein